MYYRKSFKNINREAEKLKEKRLKDYDKKKE